MLFLLSLAAVLETSLTKEDIQLIATALYYKDVNGRVLLVTGALPNDVTHIIQNDIRSRLNTDLPITVVPMYNSVDDIPYRRHVVQHLKDTFPALHSANISKEKAVNMFRDMNMRKYMLSPLQKYWMRMKNRRPRPEWDDRPTSNDEDDIPSIRPPKPKSGEVPHTNHAGHINKDHPDTGLGHGANHGEQDNNLNKTITGYEGQPSNSNNDSQSNIKDSNPNGNNNNLNPSALNPSGNLNEQFGNIRPYTTNFSYLDPFPLGKSSNTDNPLRPFTSNFSDIDPSATNLQFSNINKPKDSSEDSLRPFDAGNYRYPASDGSPPSTKTWTGNEFIPNDIYYGIEKSCANWNPLCDSRSPNLGSIPMSLVKFPNPGKPPFAQWLP